MADHCAWCGSTDVQALGGTYSCLACHQETTYAGEKADEHVPVADEDAPHL